MCDSRRSSQKRVAAVDPRAGELEPFEVLGDRPAGSPVALDERDGLGAARQRLDPHRAGAGEEVEHAGAVHRPDRLNAASRTRSPVGRVASPFGAAMRAPRCVPAMTLMPWLYHTAVQDSRATVTEEIEIRRLSPPDLHEQLDALARVLHDCVSGGASVSYMAPFSHEQARDAFAGFAAEVEQGRRLLLAAFADGELVGTVQVILALPPNQPHRAEIAKLLVHRSARKRGIARL